MRTVYKYELGVGPACLLMPINADILHFGYDPAGKLCIWAKVDTDLGQSPRAFLVTGTGHDLREAEIKSHIGTAVCGDLVWHAFELFRSQIRR